MLLAAARRNVSYDPTASRLDVRLLRSGLALDAGVSEVLGRDRWPHGAAFHASIGEGMSAANLDCFLLGWDAALICVLCVIAIKRSLA